MLHFKETRSTIDRFSDGKDLIVRNIVADRSISLDSEDVPYYGKVNYNFNPVQPKEEFLRPIASRGSRVVSALDFVTDAFEDLKNYMKKAAYYNKIGRNSVFANIIPVAGYHSIDSRYRSYLINIFDGFMGEYVYGQAKKDKIRSFRDFMNMFINYANLIVDEYPLTKSAFYLTLDRSYQATGLSIRVSNLPIHTIINDLGYDFFIKSARKFGFLVDRNQPNVIVANIMSAGAVSQSPNDFQPQFGDRVLPTGMVKYLDEYGLTSEELFRDRYFSLVYNRNQYAVSEFNLLKTYLLQFYDTFRFSSPTASATKICFESGEPKTLPYRILREGFQFSTNGDYPDDFKVKHPNSFWLSVYFNIKLVEMKRPATSKEEYNRMLNKIMTVYRSRGLGPALGHIHSVTKTIPTMTDYMRDAISLRNRRKSTFSRNLTRNLSVPTGGSTGGGMSGY